jgi:hypothetical protein
MHGLLVSFAIGAGVAAAMAVLWLLVQRWLRNG